MLAPESTSNVVGKPLSRRDIIALFLLISGWEACRVKISSSLLSRETYSAYSTGAVSPRCNAFISSLRAGGPWVLRHALAK